MAARAIVCVFLCAGLLGCSGNDTPVGPSGKALVDIYVSVRGGSNACTGAVRIYADNSLEGLVYEGETDTIPVEDGSRLEARYRAGCTSDEQKSEYETARDGLIWRIGY